MPYPHTTDLAVRLTLPELVREFDLGMHELKQGLKLIRQAESRLQKAFAGPGSHYDLVAFKHDDVTLDFEKKRLRMRGAAWRYLVSRAEIKKLASIRRAREIDDMLAKPETLPEITIDNLMGWVETLDRQAASFLDEAAVEVYQWLRPARQRYVANNPFKIGKRVVLTGMVEPRYMSRNMHIAYHAADKLRALDNVFYLLDGKGPSPTRGGVLADTIEGMVAGDTRETAYFRLRPFLNGNLHLEFLRPDLVQKLNQLGGNGLPQAA